MGVLKKSTPRKSETKIIPDEKDGTLPFIEQKAESGFKDPSFSEEEGQLSVDVFQTADEIVVVAPVAGVKIDDLALAVNRTDDNDEVLTIRGKRNLQFKVENSDYVTQECFWGNFSRSIILPEAVDASKVAASFKNGVLTVRIPKVEKIRTRMVKIREE